MRKPGDLFLSGFAGDQIDGSSGRKFSEMTELRAFEHLDRFQIIEVGTVGKGVSLGDPVHVHLYAWRSEELGVSNSTDGEHVPE